MNNRYSTNHRSSFLIFLLLLSLISAKSQGPAATNNEIDFVSDTQQPLGIEKIRLKANHNTKATAMIFSEILTNKPSAVYILGDVVGLGSSNRKWNAVDNFIDSCHKEKIDIHAILGNHDLMWTRKGGERNFSKRFPGDDKVNYISIADSIAMVMLNSNFKKLSTAEISKQSAWYTATLNKLDSQDDVKMIIVCCHHAPYSNSLIVGSSKPVQERFVPGFLQSVKCKLFITGHAHAFEHFRISGKDFLTIGGGGGLHQPLDNSEKKIPDLAAAYKPMFHYLTLQRNGGRFIITSRYLRPDFSGFQNGYTFEMKMNE